MPTRFPICRWLPGVLLLTGGCTLTVPYDGGTEVTIAGPFGLNTEQRERLAVFDTYWDALDKGYLFFAPEHVDWRALRERYRPVVPATRTEAEFWHLMAAMLGELSDPHLAVEAPLSFYLGSSSCLDLSGWRFSVGGSRWDQMNVTGWPEGWAPIPPAHLSAQDAAHPEVVRIDGARPSYWLMGILLWGDPGSDAEFELKWPDGSMTRHLVRRPAHISADARAANQKQGLDEIYRAMRIGPDERMPVDSVLGLDVDADGIAWLKVRSFEGMHIFRIENDQAVFGEEVFVARLEELLARIGDAKAVVVDLRGPSGGELGCAAPLVRRFLPRTARGVPVARRFGVPVGDAARDLGLVKAVMIELEPKEPVYRGPVVVITERTTASQSEGVARVLQVEASAMVVGEQTIGAEAEVAYVQGPDGSLLRFGAIGMRDPMGRGWQGKGILPDILVQRPDAAPGQSAEDADRAYEDRIREAVHQAIGVIERRRKISD